MLRSPVSVLWFVIVTDALPWSPETHRGSQVILQGIDTKTVPVPLHWVHLVSDLVTLLLGNDIAGGNITPVLEVVDNPCGESFVYLV